MLKQIHLRPYINVQVETCPWRDSNGNVDVRMFARDHAYGAGAEFGAPAGVPASDGGLDTNETYDPVNVAENFGADAGSIANEETFIYTMGITYPAPGRWLSATLVWTDQAGTVGNEGALVYLHMWQ